MLADMYSRIIAFIAFYLDVVRCKPDPPPGVQDGAIPYSVRIIDIYRETGFPSSDAEVLAALSFKVYGHHFLKISAKLISIPLVYITARWCFGIPGGSEWALSLNGPETLIFCVGAYVVLVSFAETISWLLSYIYLLTGSKWGVLILNIALAAFVVAAPPTLHVILAADRPWVADRDVSIMEVALATLATVSATAIFTTVVNVVLVNLIRIRLRRMRGESV